MQYPEQSQTQIARQLGANCESQSSLSVGNCETNTTSLQLRVCVDKDVIRCFNAEKYFYSLQDIVSSQGLRSTIKAGSFLGVFILALSSFHKQFKMAKNEAL